MSCNVAKLVTQISLGTRSLTGSIPSAIGDLLNLQYLYLDNNQLSSSLPSSMGQLTALVYLCVARARGEMLDANRRVFHASTPGPLCLSD